MTFLDEQQLVHIVKYLKSVNNAISFIIVSKKCLKTMELVNNNPCYHKMLVNNKNTYKSMIDVVNCVEQELSLFPSLQTIVLDTGEFSLQILSILASQKKPIAYLTPISNDDVFLKLGRFIDLLVDINLYGIRVYVDLCQFPNLRNVKLETWIYGSVDYSKLFPNTSKHFNKVRIVLQQSFSTFFFKCIDTYSIDNLIVDINDNKTFQKFSNIPNILQHAKVVCKQMSQHALDSSCIFDSIYFDNTDCTLQHQIIKNYLPTTLSSWIESDYDMSNFSCINEYYAYGECSICLPNSLTKLWLFPNTQCSNLNDLNLKELVVFNEFDITIPSTITRLELANERKVIFTNPSSLIELSVDSDFLSLPFNQFNNITKLEIVECSFNTPLTSLTSLQYLCLGNSCEINVDLNTFYPTSLTYLESLYTLIPLTTSAIKLKIDCDNDFEPLTLSNLTTLTQITICNSRSNNILYPTSLKKLHLEDYYVNTTLDLISFTFISNISLKSFQNSIDFPTSLRKLCIGPNTVCDDNNINNLALNTFMLFDNRFNCEQIPKNVDFLYISSDVLATI
ncbi:F-box domain-containing protein [Entamoeba marina]